MYTQWYINDIFCQTQIRQNSSIQVIYKLYEVRAASSTTAANAQPVWMHHNSENHNS